MIIGKARQVHFVKRVSHARVILVLLSLAARKQLKCLALVEDKIRSSYLLQVENMRISETRSMVSFLLVSTSLSERRVVAYIRDLRGTQFSVPLPPAPAVFSTAPARSRKDLSFLVPLPPASVILCPAPARKCPQDGRQDQGRR